MKLVQTKSIAGVPMQYDQDAVVELLRVAMREPDLDLRISNAATFVMALIQRPADTEPSGDK